MVQTTVLGLVTLALSSYGSPDMEGQSLENLQKNTEQWVKEIQLSGTFRLRGKGFASLVTPEGSFWVEEGKFSSGYKLIELDISQSQPSALIQKGDQQAWIGLRSVNASSNRNLVVRKDELKKRLDDSGTTTITYVLGENEPFTGTEVRCHKNGSKTAEIPYIDGKRNGTMIWYSRDGSKSFEMPYVDGKIHGTEVRYHKNGNKKEEASWVDNKLHGTKIDYYEDGSKKYEITIVNGKAHGTAIMYGWDGSKASETVYENGKEISRKEF